MLMTRSVSSTSSRSARLSDLEPHRLAGRGAEHVVEHPAEGRQALERERLLEQRPAVLVEALLVEGGRGATADDGRVGLLGLRVALGREQQLAAPELHLVELRALRIALHDAIERGERLLGLAGGLVGARQLVQHLVVARVVGVGLEQRRVELDGLGALQVDRRDLVLPGARISPASRLRSPRRRMASARSFGSVFCSSRKRR